MRESLEELMDKHVLNSFELNGDLHAMSIFFFPILKPFEWKFIKFCCCCCSFLKGKLCLGFLTK